MWQCISPKYFYQKSSRTVLWLTLLACFFLMAGLVGGLYLAPADYQQGDAFRIIYIHVPSSFMSLTIYSFMAICASIVLIWKIKLAEIFLKVSVAIGLWMTFIALVTGSIWGKPMWGTAWIWDARLTSELILFFLYFAILAILNGIRDPSTASKVAAMIVLIGVIDLPIIHYSVNWWNTLHQGSTITRLSKPTMETSMLYPLLSMIAGFMTYSISLIIYRTRTEILCREKNSQWVMQHFSSQPTL